MTTLTQHDFVLEPDDMERLANLNGPFDEHLRQIELRLGVEIANRGNVYRVSGDEDSVKLADRVIRDLFDATRNETLTGAQISLRLSESNIDALNEKAAENAQDVAVKVKRGTIRGRGPNQQKYLHAIARHDINFGVGPAGTGKTYLAVAMAVEALNENRAQRLILVRPAVEAGEKLGFLPGDLTQKVDPYLRPLYDALYEMMGIDKVTRLVERNVIEIAPLAYMRGRTLNDSFVILDEAQNTTVEQMKMFLTRIGFGSVAVVTGDLTQTDLPRHVKSGLRDGIDVLKDVDGISFTFFTARDVVRHPLVQRIVRAYEAHAEAAEPKKVVSPSKPSTGFRVNVESHVEQKGVPDVRTFEKWVRAALQGQRSKRRQVNIQLFDLTQARAINKTFTGKDYATNVLSFPYEPLRGEKTAVLGDIVICPAVVENEAKEQDKRLRDHYAHLTVHGVLHLLGFDHQDEADAKRMEEQERRVLSEFGIADPYTERD